MFPDACALVFAAVSAPVVIPLAVNLVAATLARWFRPWHGSAATEAPALRA